MKIYDIPRGTGKTTRALTISEYNAAPILCSTRRERELLIHEAKKRSFNIPDPITVAELYGRKLPNGVVIDELFSVLKQLIAELNGIPVDIKAVTFSSETDSCK